MAHPVTVEIFPQDYLLVESHEPIVSVHVLLLHTTGWQCCFNKISSGTTGQKGLTTIPNTSSYSMSMSQSVAAVEITSLHLVKNISEYQVFI